MYINPQLFGFAFARKILPITAAYIEVEIFQTNGGKNLNKIFKAVAVAVFFAVLIGFVAFVSVNAPDKDGKKFTLFKTESKQGGSSQLFAENPRFPENAEVRDLSFSASENYVKALGRTVFENGVRWFSMSGSGIEFLCDGDSVTVTCRVYNSQYISYNHRPRVIAFVNGEQKQDIVLDNESEDITLDISEYSGDCTVKLIKVSEGTYSTVGVSGISAKAKGDICPSPRGSLKIEFLGDSITCGYGLDAGNVGSFSTRTENYSETYAYLASKELGADAAAVSFSGYGVLTGFPSNGMANDYVIFKYYENALVNCDDVSAGQYWNFTANANDLVVINLGTNDASYCYTEDRRNSFVDEYKRLLSLVRLREPNAYILCVLGDMNNSLYTSIERAVSEYQDDTYDSRVKCATLSFEMGTYGSVIDGHPTKQSNALAAETLVSEIKSLGILPSESMTSDSSAW